MKLIGRALVAALGGALVAAVPALAQHRALVIGAYGGGYTHLNNLNSTSQLTADFRPGFNLGATVGVRLNDLVGLHSDFTYARSRARGETPFAGADVSRMFIGAHVEVAYQMMAGLKGYAFAGGGLVRIEQASPEVFTPFEKPAGMVGLGMFVTLPKSNFDLMIEGKGLAYKFDRAGFNRTLFDVTYDIGLAYRVPLP